MVRVASPRRPFRVTGGVVAVVLAALLATVLPGAPASAAAAPATFTVSGTVYLGSKAATAGAADITFLENSVNGPFPYHSTTDAAGAFSFEMPRGTTFLLIVDNVGPGNFAPYLSSPLGGPSCAPQGYLSEADDLTDLAITLPRGGEITGTVSDATGRPQADVDVTAQDISSCVSLVFTYPRSQIEAPVTGEDGVYELRNLTASTPFGVTFTAREGGFGSQDLGAAAWLPIGGTFPVQPGQVRHENKTLIVGGTLTGRVTCSCDPSTITASAVQIDLQGFDPVAKTWVRTAGGSVTRDGSALTYEARRLTPGTYRVATSYASSVSDAFTTSYSASVSVADAKRSTLDVTLASAATSNPGVSAAVNSYITSLYHDYLARIPASSEVSCWASVLAGGAPRGSIALGFADSDEYRLIRIDATYSKILWRAPDATGRASWLASMKRGDIRTEDIEKQFYASDEYHDRQGVGDGPWIAALYNDILQRQAGPSEIDYWAAVTTARGRAAVIDSFWQARETAQKRVAAMYASYLGRSPDAGGLKQWTDYDLAAGDTLTRMNITSSDEYYLRAAARFPVGR